MTEGPKGPKTKRGITGCAGQDRRTELKEKKTKLKARKQGKRG
jgi:hypothetical protein